MSTKQTSFDLYQTVTDKIITLLEQGTIPWQRPWRGGPPMNAITKRPYQGINLWLLMCLNYESNLFLTYDQALKVGSAVRRGEHGHIVVYWHIQQKEQPESEDGGKKTSTVPFLRYHKVFNVEQCEGLDASLTATEMRERLDPILACENIVVEMPQAPQIKFSGSQAYYHAGRDYVNMPKMTRFKDAEGYYGVLFHELIHSTGHRSRLNRPTISEMSEFGSSKYSNEELIAELGAAYLTAYAGIGKHIRNNAAYIQGWLSRLRDDRRIMLHASSYAQKAVDYILQNSDFAPAALTQTPQKPVNAGFFLALYLFESTILKLFNKRTSSEIRSFR